MEKYMNFKEEYQKRLSEVEGVLAAYLPEKTGYQATIMEAMEYSLLAGGKRIRPILMLETYRMFGGQTKVVEPFLAAMEMIHTYSLVHDDLPAMDDDDYRRGRKTTHLVYGEDMGILAGDALLNYAFEVACEAFTIEPSSHAQIAAALRMLAHKAGIYGMLGGQVIDVQATGTRVSQEKLDEIYRLKTGALLESSMCIGAILAGANLSQVTQIEQIAAKIGLAFQIQDDILDVTSTKEVLGKDPHSDEKNEKMTYVTYHGLDGAKQDVERLSTQAMELLDAFSMDSAFLAQMFTFLMTRQW
jgi:geranylgeranyl diphosphate synthase type II